MDMRNWLVDTKEFKNRKEQYTIWRLENLINFGLGKEKIGEKGLRKNIDNLYIDNQKSNFLKLILFAK
jgi:hypothetical protein